VDDDECCGCVMAFDVLSFLAGIAAGLITGTLAGILHGLESTANLQERLRQLTKEVEDMRAKFFSSGGPETVDRREKVQLDELQMDLEEIQGEIRRMYKKSERR